MIKTILVPLDGSIFSERALPLAGELARALDARLVLVCVAGPDTSLEQRLTEVDRRAIAEQYADVHEEDHLLSTDPRRVEHTQQQVRAVAEAELYLEEIQRRIATTGCQVEMAVPYGDPVEGILTEIELRAAGLVVMSTHGRAGLSRLMAGSVAQALVARATIPVVLVPPEHR